MAQTLGQAYKGYGDARRDWMEKERRVETVKSGLEFGADVAFAVSGELAAAEKTNQEFETSQKILGDDVQEIDLDTGEAWKERSILGRGDSVSYLNPFEWGGERGLRAGDTLYSEADVAGISQSEDFLTLRAGNEKELANYRENIKSVYGTDAKDTDWWKKEQADIKSSAEASRKQELIEAAGKEAGAAARLKQQKVIDERKAMEAAGQKRLEESRIGKMIQQKKDVASEASVQKSVSEWKDPLMKQHEMLKKKGYYEGKYSEGEDVWQNIISQVRKMNKGETTFPLLASKQP